MPRFVRAGIREDRWFVHPEIEWLPPGEVQADALGDLRTQDNAISVYETDNGLVAAERVAIAVAAGRQNPGGTGYAVFERAAVEALGIEIHKSDGRTADATVNALHYDIRVGTARALAALAGVVAQGDISPILPKRVKELLNEGLANGHLDRSKMNQELLAKL